MTTVIDTSSTIACSTEGYGTSGIKHKIRRAIECDIVVVVAVVVKAVVVVVVAMTDVIVISIWYITIAWW